MQFRASLRLRVAAGFALLGLLVSLFLGGWIAAASRELERRLIDETLAAEAEDYRARLGRNPQSLPPLTKAIRGYLGREIGTEDDLPEPLRELPAGLYAVTLPEGSYRVLVAPSTQGQVVMLYNLRQVQEREARLLGFLLLGIGLTALLSAAGGWWLAGRVIAPVGELARRVRELGPSDLGAPLARNLPPDEVGEMAQAFERYFARLQAFIEREQAFAADASHELRTPLAVIQSGLEVLQAEPGLRPRVQALVDRMARTARAMGDLTATLLMLAREGRGEAWETSSCSVDEVLREVVEQHLPLLQHKPVELEVDVRAHPMLPVPRQLLAIAMGNLVRNAFAYTEEGCVSIRLDGDRLTVSDTGPGIPADQLCCLFEHSAKARRAVRGAGIGLPLVKRVADRQGWAISAESGAGQGAVFCLDFTRSAGGAQDPALALP
jgi:signal transduction histidine kinase